MAGVEGLHRAAVEWGGLAVLHSGKDQKPRRVQCPSPGGTFILRPFITCLNTGVHTGGSLCWEQGFLKPSQPGPFFSFKPAVPSWAADRPPPLVEWKKIFPAWQNRAGPKVWNRWKKCPKWNFRFFWEGFPSIKSLSKKLSDPAGFGLYCQFLDTDQGQPSDRTPPLDRPLGESSRPFFPFFPAG